MESLWTLQMIGLTRRITFRRLLYLLFFSIFCADHRRPCNHKINVTPLETSFSNKRLFAFQKFAFMYFQSSYQMVNLGNEGFTFSKGLPIHQSLVFHYMERLGSSKILHSLRRACRKSRHAKDLPTLYTSRADCKKADN